MIQQTSLEAFNEAKKGMNEHQTQIFAVIVANSGISNHEISKKMGWEINSVTPRVLELRKMGLVKQAGIKQDQSTGRNVIGWENL